MVTPFMSPLIGAIQIVNLGVCALMELLNLKWFGWILQNP